MPAMPNDPSSVRAGEDCNEGKEAEMPATVKEAFEEFHEALKLDPTEREDAIETHNAMREHLKESGVVGDSILQGSFARKTMLSPLRKRDVDIVAFLKDPDSGSRVLPDQAMRLIEDALRLLHPSAIFTRLTHAVKSDLGDDKPKFDIVPAYDRNDGSRLIDIANRDNCCWDESDTRIIIDKVSKRNQKCGGNFIHQVRMAKQWAKNIFGDDIPGFVMECIAYQAIDDDQEHAEALGKVFSAGAEMVMAGEVNVPSGDENVLDRLSEEQLKELYNELEGAKDLSEEALRCEKNDDDQDAIGIWHKIFGDLFPDRLLQSPKESITKLAQGGVTITGHATVSSQAHMPTPPTRSWRNDASYKLEKLKDSESSIVSLAEDRHITLKDILDRPEEVCSYIVNQLYVVTSAEVVKNRYRCVILRVIFRPIIELLNEDFPEETVGIEVHRDGQIWATPHNALTRRWKHHNVLSDLCLWYPQDPRRLRWEWEDGFIAYLGIVSRHLQAEEWYRRYGYWPFEDAPHGHNSEGSYHPILSEQIYIRARRVV